MSKAIANDLLKIFKSSVSAVLPDNLIRNSLKYCVKSQTLSVVGDSFNVAGKNVYIVGTGKAVQSMARETESILQDRIKKGIVSIPHNSYQNSASAEYISYYEGAKNNLPDAKAESTTVQICELTKSLGDNDILLVLISGGGSALLPLAKPPIKLEEKTALIKALANSGANIQELNIVRKKISTVKGGKLALMAQPAQVISLVLSDIVGDPLDLIASAPTVENMDDGDKALNVLKKYNLLDTLPISIKTVLAENESANIWPEQNVRNYIIGSNKLSIRAAFESALKLNYTAYIISNQIVGNVNEIAKKLVDITKVYCDFIDGKLSIDDANKQLKSTQLPGLNVEINENVRQETSGICLIFGGETTVHVKGSGMGGRNQQLALEFSQFIHKNTVNFNKFNIYILSAGTDGIDGPTDAAGAIGYKELVSDAINDGMNVENYLKNNDSYNFYKNFKNGDFHVITGHTNTNVMDIQLILIMKSNS